MRTRAFIIILSIKLFSSALLFAQVDPDALADRMIEQINVHPYEKLHIHTDKAVYVAGETLWLRAYLTDGLYHETALALSRYVYVDLVNPLGDIVSSIKIRPDTSGVFYNNLSLDVKLAQGYYTLRGYTNYMLDRQDYIFNKSIYIYDIQSHTLSVVPNFDFKEENKFKVSFDFKDLSTGRDIDDISNLKISLNKNLPSIIKTSTEQIEFLYNANISNVLYLEFETSGRKYSRYIHVPNNNTDYDVTFYPEGGYLIADCQNRVGFKSLGSDGFSHQTILDIYDEDDNYIATSETGHGGIGSFIFTPEEGKRYYAIAQDEKNEEKRFDLPIPHNNTLSFSIKESGGNYNISINKGATLSDTTKYILLLQMRGVPVYTDLVTSKTVFTINRYDLPTGLNHALLLDRNYNPISERLFFNINPEDNVELDITPDETHYYPRSKITLSLDSYLQEMTYPVDGFLSVSVTNDQDVEADTKSSIMTTFLLNSELRGHIEDPAYYFKYKEEDRANDELDNLLLTHGWRRYDIPSVLREEYSTPRYEVEQGHSLTGKVTSLLFRSPIKEAIISVVSSETGFFMQTVTDDNGRFEVTGFEYPDSIRLVVQALTASGSGTLEINFDAPKILRPEKGRVIPLKEQYLNVTETITEELSDYIKKSEIRYVDEYGEESILLNAAYVTAERKVIQATTIHSFQASPMATITYEDIAKKNIMNMRTLIGLLSGAKVERGKVYLGHGNLSGFIPAAIIIDGVYINTERGSPIPGTNPIGFDIERDISINDIERIEMNKHGFGLGIRGGGGALIITTKSGMPKMAKEEYLNVKEITLKGFDTPSEFYSPKYDTPASRNSTIPDLRTTLFWKPDIKMENGAAMFDFYSADAAATYTVIVEGIGKNGELLRSVKKLKVGN